MRLFLRGFGVLVIALCFVLTQSGCREEELVNDGEPISNQGPVSPAPDPDPQPAPDPVVPAPPEIPDSAFTTIHDVGPGQTYADPSQVPWESIGPGTLVRIHYREQPYADKWVLAVSGTAEAPVVVRGIPSNGKLPVITGVNAKTRSALDYWNRPRSVIKVGGSSRPSAFPSHITIENLDVRSGRPPYTFKNASGATETYSENAASVHIEQGSFITIRNCILHDSGNGIFTGSSASDVLVEKNHVYDNGIEGSIYHHNSYTESLRITFQYNHYGPPRAGALGNSLKDRSAGLVVRYNWMDGGNRPLDLVDSGHAQFIANPVYRDTFVYGNVLIKNDVSENGQVVHYGGDSGDTTKYRKGTLWFFHNTIVSYRSGNTTLLGLSSSGERAEAFNNIVHATAGGAKLAVAGSNGTINFINNWITTGWRTSHSTFSGTLSHSNILAGASPGLAQLTSRDYSLVEGSQAIDSSGAVPSGLPAGHFITQQYVAPRSFGQRAVNGIALDLGAFER